MNGRRRLVARSGTAQWRMRWRKAIGAQAASPQRQVISLSGDGGFTHADGDLLSLSQLKLPVKVIVFNNGSLRLHRARTEIDRLFSTPETELGHPNFAAMAEGHRHQGRGA